MNQPGPSFTVDVDVTNPGQFFACCGLLELAHRLWPDAEGWFDTERQTFAIRCSQAGAGLECLLRQLHDCPMTAASDLERSGALRIGKPFRLVLDWWQDKKEPGQKDLKTWAGQQRVDTIALAARDALSGISNLAALFEYNRVLGQAEPGSKVEPFYFDARRRATALDTGWSLNEQKVKTPSHPAVELLCLTGLQRFRPCNVKEQFAYTVWTHPLGPSPAAAIVGGSVQFPGCKHYRFQTRAREGQGKYEGFDFASLIGDRE